MTLRPAAKFVIAVGVCELMGVLGSIFTAPTISSWFVGLEKPALNPPAWVFAPVWTALYFLMGVAAFLVWQKGLARADVRKALIVFDVQLAFNLLWTVLFFGLHEPLWAFVEIILLWLTIMWTIVLFWKMSRPASWLLIPYVLWVSFAAYLNFALWQLNA